jgi:two-component system, cell cycle response regulator
MNKDDAHALRELNEQLSRLSVGDFSPPLTVSGEAAEFRALADSICRLAAMLAQAQDFVSALSQGKLDVDPPPRNPMIAPLKQLHANLRHLTWQTKEIAAGDLDQHVDFMGEFSVAFNSMTEALREKRLAEEKVFYVSIHDPLTDLYNRGYFEEEMARAERGRNFPVSIMMADLDGLKAINDTLGHAVGDRLIKDAANVLRKAVRSNDVVARMGGDEFALILPGADTVAAARVIDRIREIEADFNSGSPEYQVRFSIGFATSGAGESLAETLKCADERMYVEKFARKAALIAARDKVK